MNQKQTPETPAAAVPVTGDITNPRHFPSVTRTLRPDTPPEPEESVAQRETPPSA